MAPSQARYVAHSLNLLLTLSLCPCPVLHITNAVIYKKSAFIKISISKCGSLNYHRSKVFLENML